MKTLIPTSLVAGAMLLPFVSATELKPARLLATEQVDEQLAKLQSRLGIVERQFDPFGQLQDPNAVRPAPAKVKRKDREQDGGVQNLQFVQVVNRIPIAAVMPGKGQVMIGGRLFKLGQEIPVSFKGRNFDVEIIKVRPGQVEFRDPRDGGVAIRKFNQQPDFLKKEQLPKDFDAQPHIELN